jgi:G3E family GTPase
MRPIGSHFLSATADRERLPVVLMSGFLGSGKTTLVNAMLREPAMARTAVAVNEFGAVPIDAELIDHGSEKTVVMANGCLCCNLAGDMEEAVMRLFTRAEDGALPAFERLIVEPSGLADPAPIAQGIMRNPMLSQVLRLEAIVTTVDALFGRTQLLRHAETVKQVALADRLVVTKSDLVDAVEFRALEAEIRRVNQTAPIFVADHGALDAGSLLPGRFLRPTEPQEREVRLPEVGFFAEESIVPGEAGHLQGVASIVLSADRPLNWRSFERWLSSVRLTWSDQLLRVKGFVDVAGVDGPVVVQGVHHVMHAPVERLQWPASGRTTCLVFIVDIVIENNIRESWTLALPGMTADIAS